MNTSFRNALVAMFAKAAEIGAISKDGKRKKVSAKPSKWEWIKKIRKPKDKDGAKPAAPAAPAAPARVNQHTKIGRYHDDVAQAAAEVKALIAAGVKKSDATKMVTAVKMYTRSSSKIRAAQNGTLDKSKLRSWELADEFKKYADGVEKYIDAKGTFDPQTPIYRGIVIPEASANQFTVGNVIDMGGAFSSWSSSKKISDGFANPDVQYDHIKNAVGGGDVVGVMITLRGGAKRSASINGVSDFPQEAEVVVGRGTKFVVKQVKHNPATRRMQVIIEEHHG